MRKLLSVILWSALMIVSMPLSTMAGRADYRVIPLPESIQTDTTKVFTLQPGMTIAYDASNPEIARTAQMLCQWAEQQIGLRLQLAPSAKKAAVRLAVSTAKKGVSTSPADSYSLTVGKTGITITAAEPIGIFRGVQTLRKSLPSEGGPVELPFVTIADEPRFSYRGVHLDCARHYFPVAVVKQYLDLPGHMQAALHVYPNLGCTGGPYPVWQVWGVSEDVLCAGNPDVLTFIKTVLGELCDVFPSRLIHIGGDECPKVRWKNCPKCQAKIRELQLKDDGKHSLENQLQSYINHEVEKFLTTRGRNLIGWDEILEGGLTEGAVVMSWRGVNGGIEAARQHHRVIMTPTDYCYIDYYQLKDTWNQPLGIGGYVPASKVYSFEPLMPGKLTEEEQQYILGPQVNLWTEYIAAPEHLFFMLLPRLDAISEVQWCQPGQKNFDDFKRRLPRMMQLYDRLAVSYCRKVE